MRFALLLFVVFSTFANITNGEQVRCAYDDEKRLIELHLPDDSLIQYEYEGKLLKKVSRKNTLGVELYTHCYEWDAQGFLTKEHGWFTTCYSYDSSGRLFSQSSPYLQETLDYDATGHLIRKGNTSYSYDSYGQLTVESNHFQADYDERYNLTALNGQKISVDTQNHLEAFSYDSQGNLLKPGFVYDHAHQLIEASDEEYAYDDCGRRLRKGNIDFLYLGFEEIGALENGQIKELKIPGIRPIAIEIDGKPYAPVIDAQGIIRMLVDPLSGQVVRENHCDTFGSGLDGFIPYAYWGKRFDPETGLIYFGRRYYDPSLRRWLTPDPLGAIDHPNLYQFVYNNPLRYYDPIGTSIWGYLLGLGEIVLGGTIMAGGLGLEVLSCGGFTFGFVVAESSGAALVGHGLSMTTTHAQDMSGSYKISKNDPGTPQSRETQQEQSDDAKREIERLLGRKLTPEERGKFHSHVSGQGYGYHEMVEEGYWLLGGS